MQDKIGRLQLLIGQRKIEGHGQEKECTTRLGRPHADNSGDTTLAPPLPSSPPFRPHRCWRGSVGNCHTRI
jgi:hypothetical protein